MDSAAKRKSKVGQIPAFAGVFAIRSPSRMWVGCSRSIETARRSLWFQLRNGVHSNTALQHEWNLCGEESFAFELLEEVREQAARELEKELRRRREQWARRAGALEL